VPAPTYVHRFELFRFAREANDLQFDIMLEVKAKRLAYCVCAATLFAYAPSG
jgi:hypothetical protein